MSEEQSPIGNQTSAEPLAARKSPVAAFAPKLTMTPAVMLAVLIIVLLGVLIFMVLRNGM